MVIIRHLRLRGLDFIERLEKEIGKPVTNSNQPAVRAALKLGGLAAGSGEWAVAGKGLAPGRFEQTT